MKAQMSEILALVFSVMLSFAAVEGLQCHRCHRIRDDNTCPKPQVCAVPANNYCFIQRISKGGHIKRIHRGCSTYCHQAIRLGSSFIKYTVCCRTDFCNKYHSWLFD